MKQKEKNMAVDFMQDEENAHGHSQAKMQDQKDPEIGLNHSARVHNGNQEKLSPLSPHRLLTIRSHSGLSGDIFLSGLAVLNLLKLDLVPDSEEARLWLSELCARIMPELSDCASLVRSERFGIYGWSLDVRLPHAHEHRNLADIRKIAGESKISTDARSMGLAAFELLAQCEAEAHNKTIEDVHFHEVGALDSILDIFGVCELYCRLGQPLISVSPLPVADGTVICAHGILPAPAPATLKLMRGLAVRPYEGASSSGELLTPTALALLHALQVEYGPWPACTVQETALVYGQRIFSDGPNGVIFAIGEIEKGSLTLWTGNAGSHG